MVYVIVVGGLSAGLFEETARLVGAKLLKQHRTYKDMISFGLGHGPVSYTHLDVYKRQGYDHQLQQW